MSDIQQKIGELVGQNEIVLFMKGSPLFPQCGFSSRAIAILDHLDVKYETVDVLQDQDIRQGIKEFSDWPTVPQLYVKGEFVTPMEYRCRRQEAHTCYTRIEWPDEVRSPARRS